MPFHQNPHFVGRDKLMEGLRGALAAGKPGVLVQALHGMGGVGKTRLAVEYAYAHAADYDVVWFLRSDSPTTLLADYAALGVEVGAVPPDAANQTEAARIVRRWLNDHDRWLLIFDDAPEPSAVREFLPQRPGGHVVVTSRNPGWRGLGAALKVEVLGKERAADFLLERTAQTDHESAESLAVELDGLPLALEQAAAFMENTGTLLADYLTLYRARRFELLGRTSGPDDHQANVGATYSLAIEPLLADPDPTVRGSVDLLRLCAFLAPQPDTIPFFLLSGGRRQLRTTLARLIADELSLSRAIEALLRQSLIGRTETSLSVHRLVQAVVKGSLDVTETREWRDQSFRLVVNQATESDPTTPSTWPIWARLSPHIDAVTGGDDVDRQSMEGLPYLLFMHGLYLYGRSQFLEAQQREDEAVRLAMRKITTHELSAPPELTERLEQAVRLHQFGEIVLGRGSPDLAIALGGIAGTLATLGEIEAAHSLYGRAIRDYQAVNGPTHLVVAIMLNNLGNILRSQGRLSEARNHLIQSLRIKEQIHGLSHPALSATLGNLGNVLRTLGDLDEAMNCHRRALRIRETAYGPRHPSVARALVNLGLTLRARRDHPNARRWVEKGLRILEETVGAVHVDTERLAYILERIRAEEAENADG